MASIPKIANEQRRAVHARTRAETDRIKRWGRNGIFFGSTFGIAFGAIVVASPIAAGILVSGILNTFMACAVACAVIGGGFGTGAAVLSADGDLRDNPVQFRRTSRAARRPADIGPQDGNGPLAEGPSSRWIYPVEATTPALRAPEKTGRAPFLLSDAQARLNTIEAWENGNTGP